MNEYFWFAIFPYVSLTVFFLVTIIRYRMRSFSYSSLSSQFLENEQHFWGSDPFHYGNITVLGGHLFAILLPNAILGWNSSPIRLMILEVTGLAFAILTLSGVINLIIRRFCNPKAMRVTNLGDWVIYGCLVFQVITGMLIAVLYGWGSSWFATSVSPWLWSLIKLSPQVEFVAPLPLLIQLHAINAFLILFVFPFTRLVHILVAPNPYLWRKTQVVIWNWDRSQIRRPS